MSDSRLKTYALTATGTATLATAGIANADIITSSGPVDITVNAGRTTLFTLAGVRVEAINKRDGSWSTTGYALASLGPGSPSSQIFTEVSSGYIIGSGFSGGSYVSQYMSFSNNVMSNSSSFGLRLGTSVLIGIGISDGTDTFYGWVDYSLSMYQGEYTFTINNWAYNDVANQGIIAGQNTAAGSSAVPGLGGLAALAIGAAGVRSRRQRVS